MATSSLLVLGELVDDLPDEVAGLFSGGRDLQDCAWAVDWIALEHGTHD
jgi:hypothetical protein